MNKTWTLLPPEEVTNGMAQEQQQESQLEPMSIEMKRKRVAFDISSLSPASTNESFIENNCASRRSSWPRISLLRDRCLSPSIFRRVSMEFEQLLNKCNTFTLLDEEKFDDLSEDMY